VHGATAAGGELAMRDWLRYERMTAAERRRIARRRARSPRARARRRELAPRWLVTLDLFLGALALIGKVSPLVWAFMAFGAMLAIAAVVMLVLALWHWLLVALVAYVGWRLLRRYLTYRRESAEIPF
jgi:Flp pilus assembly protein TadB